MVRETRDRNIILNNQSLPVTAEVARCFGCSLRAIYASVKVNPDPTTPGYRWGLVLIALKSDKWPTIRDKK